VSKNWFQLSDGLFVRHAPNGSIAIPNKYVRSPIFLDSELAKHITGFFKFTLGNITDSDTVRLLVDKGVISKLSTVRPIYETAYVQDDTLPYYARLEVTDNCQCECDICYQSHRLDCMQGQPSLRDMRGRINALKRLGVIWLEVLGGEAFLRNDLEQICRYINECGLIYTITTNGEYLQDLSDSFIEVLKTCRMVNISLDAYGDTHDVLRKRKGLFKKAISGIRWMITNDIQVSVITVVSGDRAKDVQSLLDFLTTEFDIPVFVRKAVLAGSAKNNDLFDAKLDELSAKNSRNVYFARFGAKEDVMSARYYGCDIRHLISVRTNGRILSCHMNRQDYLAKDVTRYNQVELLQELTDKLKSNLDNSYCRDCRYNDIKSERIFCGGLCRFSQKYINMSSR
jgi:radical SAM protein with 4Fe4S-binding SPASM domain